MVSKGLRPKAPPPFRNQSGLVPLKRVKLEKVKQPMYRAKGKAAP